jgi:hypothetical protein
MDPTPPEPSTTRRIKRIAPLQLGKIMGFVVGVIGAFIYTIIAKWVGGVEVEVE